MRPSLLLALGLALASPAALADPAGDASARFQEGRQLFRAGEFARARQAFQAAYDTLPDPRVLANVAACFVSEGRAREAVAAYRRFLREAGADVPAESRDEAQREVARLVATLGDLVLAIEPAGAEVVLDGAPIGTSPLPGELAVDPGHHRLEVRGEGLAPWVRELDVAVGQRVDLRVVLEAPRPVEATHMPIEEITPAPPAPAVPAEMPLGRGPLFWSGAILTGTLVVVSIVTGSVALSQQGVYQDDGTSVARRRELYDSMNSLATATDVLLDSALVLGVGTALLYIFMGPEESPSTTTAWTGAAWGGASF